MYEPTAKQLVRDRHLIAWRPPETMSRTFGTFISAHLLPFHRATAATRFAAAPTATQLFALGHEMPCKPPSGGLFISDQERPFQCSIKPAPS